MTTITFELGDEYEDELYDMLKYEHVDSFEELLIRRVRRHNGSKRFVERIRSVRKSMFPNGKTESDFE